MPRVYVISALKPRGGTFMAYHVGLLLQQQFGYEMVSVETRDEPETRQFHYDIIPPAIALRQLESTITQDDLLIVNPSFSHLMLGLRLPGRKICYVQDFRTFPILDGYFDLYVSVSSPVQKFLRDIYGLDTRLIAPFIELKRLPRAIPWRERPRESLLVYIKSGEENRIAAHYLLEAFKSRLPRLDMQILGNNGMPHADFLQQLGSVRYLLNVSLAEGFGLIPLEAMALGTCVAGFDGVGGKDFLRFGKNSMTHGFNEIERIAATFERMQGDEAAMEALSAQGMEDAKRYNLKNFRQSWQVALTEFLE